MSTTLLEVSDITLRFGGVTAINDVSFSVDEGELFAIIGPNGAGKTSMFNCLNGVYRPQQGTILLNGENIIGYKPTRIAKLGIARTFQNLGLFTNLNVVDNLMLGRHMHMKSGFLSAAVWFGRTRNEEIAQREACEEVMRLLELEPYRNTLVGLLPYGVQKRLELGRALAMEPRILLLDEPVAGMNHEETEDMARYLLEIRGQLNTTMIMVEHDMPFVMDLADRVMAIDFGQRIAIGTPEQVRTDPAVVAAYLGGDQ
ncbi:MAG: ABC transporter ATP-binding protein [Actinobacteria bacterium]|nr:ABC transporter ATP-binding protein [Actinomycetota bacterium]MCB9388133.1 ABC transporter ATP-binding protein [Acidimicrobiia bacterium]